MKRTQVNEDRPRSHSYGAPPRSPTLVADNIRKRKTLSQSVPSTRSHRSADKQTACSPEKECHPKNQQLDYRTDTNSTNGDEIIIVVSYFDDKKKEHQITRKRSCTVEEYMKWKYILHSPNHLDQFNACVNKELNIPCAVTSDSVVHIESLVESEEILQQMCDHLVEFATNDLGKGLQVKELDQQSEQDERSISSAGVYAETLQGHVYCVYMNREHRRVAKLISEPVNRCSDDKEARKEIIVRRVWRKLSKLIDVDHYLKEQCKCPELEVAFQTYQEKLTLSLNGPETEVALAEQEFNSLDQHLQLGKCNINVTLKHAVSELQVESFLDDYLQTKSICCVTRQKQDGIFVYGLTVDCVHKAKKEIEEIIVERTCIIQKHLKQRKDLLVSYLKGRWPEKIVVHIEDSGLVHIVGVRQYVDETYQKVAELKERRMDLEEICRKETGNDVDQKVIENNESVTQSDQVIYRREEKGQKVQTISDHTEEEKEEGPNIRYKVHDLTDRQQNDVTEETSEENLTNKLTLGESSFSQKDEIGTSRQSMEDNSRQEKGCVQGKTAVEDRTLGEAGGYTVMKQAQGETYANEPGKVAEEMPIVQHNNLTVSAEDTETRQMKEERYVKEPTKIGKGSSAAQSRSLRQKEVDTAIKQTANNANEKKENPTTKEKGSQPKETTTTECMEFSDPKIKQFMMKYKARSFLIKCANENNVIIHQRFDHGESPDKVNVKEDVIITPGEEIKRKVIWLTTEHKKIILAFNGGIEDNDASTPRFVSVVFKPHKRNRESISLKETDTGVIAVVRVPDWINGKHQDKDELDDLLSRFIVTTEEAKAENVIVPLEPVHNWPLPDLVKCIISKTVENILLNLKARTPHTVTLNLSEESHFHDAFCYTRTCIHKINEARKAKQSQLEVIVVPAELDKVKSDVIVNTTSRDLDLSNGRVSATLLKTAGNNIQKECRSKYPHGISPLEVAVTGGHKLLCEKVFHIALDRYQPKKEMSTVETIRCLMTTCLKEASHFDLKSIAFPAIGTGVLRYPIDLVASAMFESVERFKVEHEDTSLTTVMFVIYPADVRVMEVFKKNEDTLGKQPEDRKRKVTKSHLDITGLRKNAQKAKYDVLDRCEDEVTDPAQIWNENLHGVTRQQFVALFDLCKEDIKAVIGDGIDITHQQEVLRMSGKRRELKRASLKIKELLDDISKLHFASLSVQVYIPEAVERAVNQQNQREGVDCVFDKYHGIIHVYAHSSRKVAEIRNLLKDSLDQEEVLEELSVPDVSEAVGADKVNNKISVFNDHGHIPLHSRSAISPEGRHSGKHLQETSDKSINLQECVFHKDEICERKKFLSRYSSYTADLVETKASGQRLESPFLWKKYTKNVRIFQINDIEIRVYEADILSLPVDCIVNSANHHLDHCGGIALTIATAAGEELLRESAKLIQEGPLSVTSVVSTTAGHLNYKRILHAVGPYWRHYKPITEESLERCQNDLRRTVINCLLKAEKCDIKAIALPTISSGQFGVPKELCAIEYAKAILEFAGKGMSLKEVHIVDINHDMIDIVQDIFQMMITHDKPLMVDMHCYIETSTTNAGTVRQMPCTGRDKPKSLNAKSEEAVSKKEDANTDSYVFDGEKMICTFSSSHHVQIYEDDILQLQEIPALVCCDNRSGEGKCELSRLLLRVNGEEYEKEKAEQFKKKRNYGDVISTAGGKSNYVYIMHAVTPNREVKALHMMYLNLFDEARVKEISCMALPLLGTGTDIFKPEESAVIFLTEWIGFIHKDEKRQFTIHLVLDDKRTATLVKGIFKAYFDDESTFEEHLKNAPTRQHDEGMVEVHQDLTTESEKAPEPVKEDCVICMDEVSAPKKLKCGHTFCTDCIEGYFRVKQVCPVCGQVCGIVTGDQPDGRMEIVKILPSCAGYEGLKSIAVSYYFPHGNQGEDHPQPGSYYRSMSRTGYLPDSEEGREICAMLKVAFERRLVFTIGTSRTTGEEGVITWNDIHHKTDIRPNTQFGYPDNSYLQRVREEMEIKGVTTDDIDENFIEELERESYRDTFTTDTRL